jgi:hypothetical protein
MPLGSYSGSDNYFFSSLFGDIVCRHRYSTRYSILLREVVRDIGALTVYFCFVKTKKKDQESKNQEKQ